MKPHTLEYASPRVRGRRPWWTAFFVIGFTVVGFMFGIGLDIASFSHRGIAASYGELLNRFPFHLLVNLQEILAGYSAVAMGIASFVRTRHRRNSTAGTWLLATVAAAGYGAIPSALARVSEDPYSSSMGPAMITGISLLITAVLVPLLLPFILLRRAAEWPG